MVNTRRNCGGFHMEAYRYDDHANDTKDLQTQVQQLSGHLARYKTWGRDNNLGFDNVNPFQFWALMGEPGEREFVERPQQNQQPRDVDLKDIPKFEWKIQPNDFID